MDAKRKLFLLLPRQPESGKVFKRIQRLLKPLAPETVVAESDEQIIALDGHVVVISEAAWPTGVLSGFTRCADLLIVAIVSSDDDVERVKLWYQLGAHLVLDEGVSKGVFLAAIERLLEIESERLRPKLTRRETKIFDVVRAAGPKGLTRPEIALRVWDDTSVQQKTIDVHVFNLRRKLNSTRFRVVCIEQRFILIEGARTGIQDRASDLNEGRAASEASWGAGARAVGPPS